MLEKVTRKAYHGLRVQDTLGVWHDLKVLNFTASGSRTGKLDRQCVVDFDTLITPGTELNLPDGKQLVVSYKQADLYEASIIRYVLDCIEVSHNVSVLRTLTTKSAQGGLASKSDIAAYTNIPVKIGLTDVVDSKVIDVSMPKYVMYLSTKYELKTGDRITVGDNRFEVAKVNSFVHVTPGLMEVRFDNDPRWP